ncbi:Trm112 family protein, partial [Thiolapillus sp.]
MQKGLACPRCKRVSPVRGAKGSRLSEVQKGLACPRCRRVWPVRGAEGSG